MPEQIIKNIKSYYTGKDFPIFKGVRSDNVSAFLDESVPGLSAKVFRTYHATKIVKGELRKANVSKESHELEKKYVATIANLEAAKACNHKKKIPKNWRETLNRMRQRLKGYKEKRNEIRANITRKRSTKI